MKQVFFGFPQCHDSSSVCLWKQLDAKIDLQSPPHNVRSCTVHGSTVNCSFIRVLTNEPAYYYSKYRVNKRRSHWPHFSLSLISQTFGLPGKQDTIQNPLIASAMMMSPCVCAADQRGSRGRCDAHERALHHHAAPEPGLNNRCCFQRTRDNRGKEKSGGRWTWGKGGGGVVMVWLTSSSDRWLCIPHGCEHLTYSDVHALKHTNCSPVKGVGWI